MRKERDTSNTIISVRLTRSEAERFLQVMDDAMARSPYVSKTDVAREVFGLTRPPKALSPTEIEFILTGNLPTRSAVVETKLVPMAVETKAVGGKTARAAKTRKRA